MDVFFRIASVINIVSIVSSVDIVTIISSVNIGGIVIIVSSVKYCQYCIQFHEKLLKKPLNNKNNNEKCYHTSTNMDTLLQSYES